MAIKRLCSVPGCGKPHRAKGFCWPHYNQSRKKPAPRPLKTAKKGESIQYVFEVQNADTDECIVWPYSRTYQGYGKVQWRNRNDLAHRAVCEVAHGPAPKGKNEARHLCGKGHLGCVNPRHLTWGSSSDNTADMIAHGTSLHGQRSARASITNETAERIRARLATESNQSAIAREFRTTYDVVHDIKTGRTFKQSIIRPLR